MAKYLLRQRRAYIDSLKFEAERRIVHSLRSHLNEMVKLLQDIARLHSGAELTVP
jgi:hypothetical protein